MQKVLPLAVLFMAYPYRSVAQDMRAFNQNASRSNHSRLSLTVSPVYSSPVSQSSDSLLFRGSGGGFRFGADYFLGKVGIGFSSGFNSSAPDEGAINNFLKKSGLPQDQLVITRAKQQNMYLLVGPSIRFGKTVELLAYAKGGVFVNNSGLVDVQQRGAGKVLYRNETAEKSLYPGFLTGLNVQYPIGEGNWAIGVGIDYMYTRSQVNNYDARRQGGIAALQLTRTVSDIVAGITVRYTIFSSREGGSGRASGRRQYEPLLMDNGGLSGSTSHAGQLRRQPQTANTNTNDPSCGPVTMRRTNPDGSAEEMTFSCPEDAANYARQTPSMARRETPLNDPPTSSTLSAGQEGTSRNIISGRVVWTSSANGASYGIVTNNSIRNESITAVSPVSDGIAAAFSARETGSGIATGKRSADAGSGRASGRRQYEPLFMDNTGGVCNPCLATVKKSSNPLYEDKGNNGTNPLYQGKMAADGNGLCGKTGHLIAILTNTDGGIIAQTNVETCGNFWFANVPDGDYVVRISGEIALRKTYDITIPGNKPIDLAGQLSLPYERIGVELNTTGNEAMQQKAGVSTSRSNIRVHRFVVIDSDTDGDGEPETTKVIVELADGTVRDVTAGAAITKNATGKKVIVRGWDPEKKESAAPPYEITISNGEARVASGKTVTSAIRHAGVTQYNIEPEEEDAVANPLYIKTFPIATGDLDGDGITDLASGNGFSGGQPLRPGNPIGGLTIKGGKNPGGNIVSRQTDGNGNFEFDGLQPGDYTFTIEQKIVVDNETSVTAGSRAGVQDHNSSRSNKSASVITNDPGNGTGSTTRVQDHNSSRSNKSASAITNDLGNGSDSVARVQDHNSSRSNKRAGTAPQGPVKWMAPESMKRNSSTAYAQLDKTIALLDELDNKLNADQHTPKAGISTSRSNIRNQVSAVIELLQTLDDLQYTEKSIALDQLQQNRSNAETQFLQLQQSLQSLGSNYSAITNTLKSSHDTAMNAIRNMR